MLTKAGNRPDSHWDKFQKRAPGVIARGGIKKPPFDFAQGGFFELKN